MTSKNDRAPLLHYIKLCASSQTPPRIQNGVTVRKRLIQVKIGDFLSCVTLKFDGWPWKTIGHLFYVVSAESAINCPVSLTHSLSWFRLTWDTFPTRVVPTRQSLTAARQATLSCGSTADSPQSRMSVLTHSAQVFRGLPRPLLPGTRFHTMPMPVLEGAPVWPWNLTDDLEKQ